MNKLFVYSNNRLIPFASVLPVLFSYLIFVLVFSIVEKLSLFALFISGGVIILGSILLLDPIPFLLFFASTLLISFAMFAQRKEQLIRAKTITKIILNVLLSIIIFLPLQIIICGFFAIALDVLINSH